MKNLGIAAVAAIVLATAAPARASLFTLDTFSVTVNDADPGLVLLEKDLLVNPFSFTLTNPGDSTAATRLFRVGTKEEALNLDDIVPYAINVKFNFTAPAAFQGSAAGLSGAGWFGQSFGYVAWDNPYSLSFGNTGVLGVSLTNAIFDLPGSDVVWGQFTLLRADTPGGPSPVPEPASMLLVGSGLVGAALRARRRRKA
jgi:hypothetical protein